MSFLAVGETQNTVTAKNVVSSFVDALKKQSNNELTKEVATHALDKLQSRVSTFEDSVSLRLLLDNVCTCRCS